MDAKLENAILRHLASGFEQDLFKAAIANVDDEKNQLRLNNFAYSMRELIRTVLERLAPDEDVINAPWFKPNDKQHPEKVTRSQRIKFAIQGWLSDEYVKRQLDVEHDSSDKDLRDSIDILSKYTHVAPKTFYVKSQEIKEMALDVLDQVQLFLSTIDVVRVQVRNAVAESIDEEMIEEFYINTQSDLDILSTHYEVKSYILTSIETISQDDEEVVLRVHGQINVRHQYGSAGDMRRGDGYEMNMSYPFSSTLTASYKNPEGDVHIIDRTMNIDTSDSWG